MNLDEKEEKAFFIFDKWMKRMKKIADFPDFNKLK